MIDPRNKLSINRQAMLLSISRSSYYYKVRPRHMLDSEYQKELEMAYLKYPIYGYTAPVGLDSF